MVVAYTDGVSEAFSPRGEEFGEERLAEVVAGARHLPAVRDRRARGGDGGDLAGRGSRPRRLHPGDRPGALGGAENVKPSRSAPRSGGRFIVASSAPGRGRADQLLLEDPVNPVTGEKQHVALNVDRRKPVGLESAPEMAHGRGALDPRTDPQARLVASWGRSSWRSAAPGGAPTRTTSASYLLADAETVNAFALPAGRSASPADCSRVCRTSRRWPPCSATRSASHRSPRRREDRQRSDRPARCRGGPVESDDGQGPGRARPGRGQVNQMVQLKYGAATNPNRTATGSSPGGRGLRSLGHARSQGDGLHGGERRLPVSRSGCRPTPCRSRRSRARRVPSSIPTASLGLAKGNQRPSV